MVRGALQGVLQSRRSSFDIPPVAGDEVQDRGKSLSFDPKVSLRAERTHPYGCPSGQCEAGPKGRMNPHPEPDLLRNRSILQQQQGAVGSRSLSAIGGPAFSGQTAGGRNEGLALSSRAEG